MPSPISYFLSGAFLGVTAGISPGPIFALVIGQTLKYNVREGIKIALIPLITELPLVLGSVFLLHQVVHLNLLIGFISILGTWFLFRMGVDNLTPQAVSPEFARSEKARLSARKSYKQALFMNFFNPQPYVFWLTIGTPLLLAGLEKSLLSGIAFVLAFYLFVVCSKSVLAWAVQRYSGFFQGKAYLWLIRATGLILIFFAGTTLWDGMARLNFFVVN